MAQRMLRKQAIVSASLAEVWRAWTTVEGVNSFFGNDADIELALGGKYEIYFDLDAPVGSRGSEGCRVLAYLPERMLAFTWNAPPSIPRLRAAGVQTQVVLQFEEVTTNRVKVTVSQHGFGQGEDWDKYYEFFDRAWDLVLGRFHKRFGEAESSERSTSAGKPGGKQRYMLFLYPSRAGFLEQPTAAERAAFSQHAGYVKQLLEDGTAILAGRCFDPPHYPERSENAAALEMPTPGIVLLEVESLERAKEIMEADPAVKSGVFQARLSPFRLAFSEE